MSETALANRGEAALPAMIEKNWESGELTVVKATKHGTIKAAKTFVPLVEGTDTWKMVVKEKIGGQWTSRDTHKISALGYDKMNQWANVAIYHPETLTLGDGSTHANPHLHKVGSTIEYVRVRLRGLGLSPLGNVIMHDCTLNFDLLSYMAESLLAKWKGYGDGAPKEWGKLYDADNVPDEVRKDGQCREFPCGSGLVLSVQLNHSEVAKLVHDGVQLVKKAIERAQTMCRRNLLRRFFAAVEPVNYKGRMGVWVTTWTQVARDFAEMSDLMNGAESGSVSVNGQQRDVEAHVDVDHVTEPDEENEAEFAADMEPGEVSDEDPADSGVEPVAPAQSGIPDVKDLRAKVRAKYAELVKLTNATKANGAMEASGFNGLQDVADCQSPTELGFALDSLNASISEHKPKSEQGSLY